MKIYDTIKKEFVDWEWRGYVRPCQKRKGNSLEGTDWNIPKVVDGKTMWITKAEWQEYQKNYPVFSGANLKYEHLSDERPYCIIDFWLPYVSKAKRENAIKYMARHFYVTNLDASSGCKTKRELKNNTDKMIAFTKDEYWNMLNYIRAYFLDICYPEVKDWVGAFRSEGRKVRERKESEVSLKRNLDVGNMGDWEMLREQLKKGEEEDFDCNYFRDGRMCASFRNPEEILIKREQYKGERFWTEEPKAKYQKDLESELLELTRDFDVPQEIESKIISSGWNYWKRRYKLNKRYDPYSILPNKKHKNLLKKAYKIWAKEGEDAAWRFLHLKIKLNKDIQVTAKTIIDHFQKSIDDKLSEHGDYIAEQADRFPITRQEYMDFLFKLRDLFLHYRNSSHQDLYETKKETESKGMDHYARILARISRNNSRVVQDYCNLWKEAKHTGDLERFLRNADYIGGDWQYVADGLFKHINRKGGNK